MTRTVRDVMTRTVVAAPESATFKEVVRLLHGYRVSALPVIGQDDRIVGVVSEGDLLLRRDPEVFDWHLLEGSHRRADRRKALGRTARELMTAPAVTIGPEATTTEAAHLMHERGLKHLPVVDAEDHVLGMVSRVDVLAAFLMGDDAIADEVEAFVALRIDRPEDVIVEVAEGVVTLRGQLEYRTQAIQLVDRVRLLDGVVGVDDETDWKVDDTVEHVSPVPWVGF
jgi:CBS domain-containing protein